MRSSGLSILILSLRLFNILPNFFDKFEVDSMFSLFLEKLFVNPFNGTIHIKKLNLCYLCEEKLSFLPNFLLIFGLIEQHPGQVDTLHVFNFLITNWLYHDRQEIHHLKQVYPLVLGCACLAEIFKLVIEVLLYPFAAKLVYHMIVYVDLSVNGLSIPPLLAKIAENIENEAFIAFNHNRMV